MSNLTRLWPLPCGLSDTVPLVEGLIDVPVLGPPSSHLLHVTLGNELLQLRNLPHPVKNASPIENNEEIDLSINFYVIFTDEKYFD